MAQNSKLKKCVKGRAVATPFRPFLCPEAKRAHTTKAGGRAQKPARWNQTRQRIFLEHLAASANVRGSQRKAGISAGSAYRLRAQSPEIRAAWGVALKEGYERLECGMLERAMSGTVKCTKWNGEITEMIEYPERIRMLLYNAHRAAATGIARGGGAGVEAETAKQRLARKLADMNRGMGGGG